MNKIKKRKIVIGGKYRHFKGAVVKVLMEASDSETEKEVVVYIHLADGKIWVREKKMFLEKIEREGKKIYRFKLEK